MDTAVNAAASRADLLAGDAHKRPHVSLKKGVEAIRGVSLEGGKGFLDIAHLLFDYATASNVADFFVGMSVGPSCGPLRRRLAAS